MFVTERERGGVRVSRYTCPSVRVHDNTFITTIIILICDDRWEKTHYQYRKKKVVLVSTTKMTTTEKTILTADK